MAVLEAAVEVSEFLANTAEDANLEDIAPGDNDA
jgi:hypothetical protein